MQTLPAAFLNGIGYAHQIRIKGDGLKFDVKVKHVQAGGANGQDVYELDMEDWNNIEEQMGLKAGMILILTRKHATKLLLTGFSIDGNIVTDGHFLGATNLLMSQPGLLLTERGKKYRYSFILQIIIVSV